MCESLVGLSDVNVLAVDDKPGESIRVMVDTRTTLRRHAARRDRRLSRPLPRRQLPHRTGRCRSRHPSLRTPPHRHLPMVSQQPPPKRALQLRWRLPTQQRLGRSPLPGAPRRRETPPPRQTHPRPHLDPHHLELLARPPALQPRPTPRPPSAPKQPNLDIGLLKREGPNCRSSTTTVSRACAGSMG